MKTLFWNQTGPLIKYDGEMLYTESLNPETKISWRMSRWKMFKTGLQFIFAAVR